MLYTRIIRSFLITSDDDKAEAAINRGSALCDSMPNSSMEAVTGKLHFLRQYAEYKDQKKNYDTSAAKYLELIRKVRGAVVALV